MLDNYINELKIGKQFIYYVETSPYVNKYM